MNGRLLDTTVLIDLSRGRTEAADFIDAARKREESLYVSVVSAMELIAGCRDKNEVEKAQRKSNYRKRKDFQVIEALEVFYWNLNRSPCMV